MKKENNKETVTSGTIRVTFSVWVLLLATCVTSFILIGRMYGFSAVETDALGIFLAVIGTLSGVLSIPVASIFVGSARIRYLGEPQDADSFIGYLFGFWLILLPETLYAVVKGKFK